MSQVFRIIKNQNYTVMSNHHLQDRRLSLKAKGLLSLMLSLRDDWSYSIDGLTSIVPDGRSAVRSALKELEEFRYIRITRERDRHGKLGRSVYYIFEIPQEEDPETEDTSAPDSEIPALHPETEVSKVSPECENRTLVKLPPQASVSPEFDFPTLENRTQLNTKELNTTVVSDKSSRYYNTITSSSVSPETGKTEDGEPSYRPMTLTEIRKQIGYDRLILRFNPTIVDLFVTILEEAFRADRRQLRLGGVLRSVKELHGKIRRLDAESAELLLNSFEQNAGAVRSVRSYLLTAVWNFEDDLILRRSLANVPSSDRSDPPSSFDRNEFFEAAIAHSLRIHGK